MPKIEIRLHSVEFGALDNAVPSCAGISAHRAAGYQPILPANYKGPDCPLAGIIVWMKVGTVQIAQEFGPLIKGISDGLS